MSVRIVLTLTLTFLIAVSPNLTAQTKNSNQQKKAVKMTQPQITNTNHTPKTKQLSHPNWTKIWTQSVTELKAEAHMFTHNKSGAPLLYLTCDDDNKVFCIAFRTPPTDNTGIAHIMEHSALCGSQKFPSKEPFVDLLKGSLQTFLNAFTSDDRTMYPVASRNNKDFRNLIDVYLDAVFFPNVKKIPEILMQEGWHYEVDETGNLSYNGIVYNEMKGVYSSPQSVLYRTIQKSMYPESTYVNDSGGAPDNIPELTQEKFIEFHNKFYHPSNSMIYIYGNGDVAEHLDFLDKEYLSKFTKQNIDAKVTTQPPFDKPKDITAEYSVDAGESTNEKTFLSMNYLLPPIINDPQKSYAFDLLTYILIGSESGPLKRVLIDAGIGLDVSCSFDSSILQPCFSIIVHNSDPDKKQQFINIIEDTLKRLVTNGVDRKLIEGAINRTEFTLREFQVSGFPKGLVINMGILDAWTYGGDPLKHLRFEQILTDIRAGVANNYFENLIKEFLIENKSRGFVMLKPKQGLEKENADKLTAKLAEIKKSLTAEQLDKIKENQQTLIKRQATPDKPEDVAKIPTLDISDIDRTAEKIPFEHTDGYLNIQTETNGIAYISVYFDALQKINVTKNNGEDYSPYVSLLSEFLTRVDTKHYSYGKLNSEIDLHTGGMSAGLAWHVLKQNNPNPQQQPEFTSSFLIRTKVMLPKLETGLNLVLEVIDNSQFDDLARLKEIIQELRVGMEQSLLSAGQRYAQLRSASYFSAYNAYKEKISGIDYYRFLVDLEKNFDKEGKNVAKKLKEVADAILHNSKAEVYVTLSAKDFANSKNILDKFKAKLSDKKSVTQQIDFKENQRNEAVIIPSRVQYVVKTADYRKSGFVYSGKMMVLANILRTGYLWNNIRVQGGAYGGGVSFDRHGVFSLWSYRDPHLKRTVDIYEGVADYLENLELSEEELTKSIIATIGSLDKPLTPAEKGGRIIGMHLCGLTQEDLQKERDEVLSTTVEDLRNFAKMFRDGMKQNNICVFGNEEKLKEDNSLFKNHIRPID
ncbi:MAG: insulinase family protein [Planctomycetaceae bacterium]|jgi:Zn-dependent M16 (insulinase) family peptidase|nr:insulinase family protein [Planctomycetaceae bacterium]